MPDKKSGRTFLERSGIVKAYRNPEPRIEPRAMSVHNGLNLQPPLPLPGLQWPLDGELSPPDRHETVEWPHPEDTE